MDTMIAAHFLGLRPTLHTVHRAITVLLLYQVLRYHQRFPHVRDDALSNHVARV